MNKIDKIITPKDDKYFTIDFIWEGAKEIQQGYVVKVTADDFFLRIGRNDTIFHYFKDMEELRSYTKPGKDFKIVKYKRL